MSHQSDELLRLSGCAIAPSRLCLLQCIRRPATVSGAAQRPTDDSICRLLLRTATTILLRTILRQHLLQSRPATHNMTDTPSNRLPAMCVAFFAPLLHFLSQKNGLRYLKNHILHDTVYGAYTQQSVKSDFSTKDVPCFVCSFFVSVLYCMG